MSEFLMVVPPGWTEIPNAEEVINNTLGDGAHGAIAQELWWEFTNALDAFGLLPAGQIVTDARLFKTGDPLNPVRLWVLLVVE